MREAITVSRSPKSMIRYDFTSVSVSGSTLGGVVTINELGMSYTLLGAIRARPVKPVASYSRFAEEEVDTSLMYRLAPMYPTVQLIAVPALLMAVGCAPPTCTGV